MKDILVYSLESTPQEIYAGTWGRGVYRKPHGAADWESLGPEEARISALALDPRSGDLFAGTNGEGLKRKINSPLRPPKWETVQGIDPEYNIWSLLIDEGAMYAGTGEHGAYKSTDGRRWSEHNSNIEAETVYALTHNRSGYYAGTGDRGVFVEAGDNWIAIGPLDTTVVRALATAPDSEVLYAGTVDTGIYRRSAGSSQWDHINMGLAGDDFDIYALAVDPAPPQQFVYAAQWGAGVYLSWDAGNSWYRLGSPEEPHPQFVLALELVRPQDAGCQILYAGASDGLWSRVIPEREFTFLPVLLRDYPEAQ